MSESDAFSCARCGWQGPSLAELLDHWCDRPAGAQPAASVPPRPRFCNECGCNWPDAADDPTCPFCGSADTTMHDDPTDPPMDLVHRPARPLKSRARVRPAAELELVPTETAPDGRGNAQSAGVRPNTPFARGTERIKAGDAWKRETPARPTVYCACGMALPMRPGPKCESCGRPTGGQQ